MKQLLPIALALCIAGCGDSSPPETPVAAPPATAAAPDAEPVTTTITDVPPAVEVIAEDIAYGEAEDHNLNGYMVLPADALDVPGIIVIHEWWGLNDEVRAIARRLAGEGYAVLAVDLYNGRTATDSAAAQSLMAAAISDREAVLDNLRQAHAYLDEWVFAPRIAAFGWGLGGGWALEAGIDIGDAVDAVVMYYGRLTTDDSLLSELSAPLLGIFAEHDQSIPAEEVRDFRNRLRDLGKSADVFIYTDVDHAFANPSNSAYNHQAATEAWEETLEFLRDRLL